MSDTATQAGKPASRDQKDMEFRLDGVRVKTFSKVEPKSFTPDEAGASTFHWSEVRVLDAERHVQVWRVADGVSLAIDTEHEMSILIDLGGKSAKGKVTIVSAKPAKV